VEQIPLHWATKIGAVMEVADVQFDVPHALINPGGGKRGVVDGSGGSAKGVGKAPESPSKLPQHQDSVSKKQKTLGSDAAVDKGEKRGSLETTKTAAAEAVDPIVALAFSNHADATSQDVKMRYSKCLLPYPNYRRLCIEFLLPCMSVYVYLSLNILLTKMENRALPVSGKGKEAAAEDDTAVLFFFSIPYTPLNITRTNT